MIKIDASVNPAALICSVRSAENTPKTDEKELGMIPENRDEYVPGEEKEPIGLYSVSPDENGDLRVSFDGEKSKPDDPESDTITANTDKVDREIKALRDKEQVLMQKLRSADGSAAEDIRRELEQVTAELAQKDNDGYRRQNTVFS